MQKSKTIQDYENKCSKNETTIKNKKHKSNQSQRIKQKMK